MSVPVPDALIEKFRETIIAPLKDAMRITEYKEHDRNYKFHKRKKINGETKPVVHRSYSFKIKGTLKHEMYLKPLNPKNIKSVLGKEYTYKLIIKPDSPIDLEYDSRNKRSIELIIHFKK